jgi:hypothetical protein
MAIANQINFPIINDPTMATATAANLSTSLATKNYIDATAAGLSLQIPVDAASTIAYTATYANGALGVGATLTNAGVQTVFAIDGLTPSVSDRVLIKNQAASADNGCYEVTDVGSGVTNWILTRVTDWDTSAEMQRGDFFLVRSGGTVNGGTGWANLYNVAVVGTDPIAFLQFSASLPINLSNGGTGANLTASNGGIVYSDASAMAILAGTSTALQMLQSGALAAPSWSTATWPATTTANQLLYSSSANTVAGLASAANGILITSAGSVPSISSTLPAAVQGNITATGTIATGVWNGTAINVAHGGTGLTTATAYAVICGGTTATGPFQSIASVGTTGQVLTSNGAGVLPTFQPLGGTATGRLLAIQYITATGIYTRTAGALTADVQVISGGGGGGAATIDQSLGGGGGSGGYARGTIDVTSIATAPVTVGAGGVASSGGNGGDGGSSSFSSLITTSSVATGGIVNGGPSFSSGGNAAGGDINIAGSNGPAGGGTGIQSPQGNAGFGASSILGGGGRRGLQGASGAAALGYGAGGGGGYRDTTTTRQGGAGSPGIIIVYEYS